MTSVVEASPASRRARASSSSRSSKAPWALSVSRRWSAATASAWAVCPSRNASRATVTASAAAARRRASAADARSGRLSSSTSGWARPASITSSAPPVPKRRLRLSTGLAIRRACFASAKARCTSASDACTAGLRRTATSAAAAAVSGTATDAWAGGFSGPGSSRRSTKSIRPAASASCRPGSRSGGGPTQAADNPAAAARAGRVRVFMKRRRRSGKASGAGRSTTRQDCERRRAVERAFSARRAERSLRRRRATAGVGERRFHEGVSRAAIRSCG